MKTLTSATNLGTRSSSWMYCIFGFCTETTTNTEMILPQKAHLTDLLHRLTVWEEKALKYVSRQWISMVFCLGGIPILSTYFPMDSNLHDQSNTVNLLVELQGKWNQLLPEWSTYTNTNEYYAVLRSSYIRTCFWKSFVFRTLLESQTNARKSLLWRIFRHDIK